MSTEDEHPLVDEVIIFRGSSTHVEKCPLLCWIFLPIIGMGIHVFVGTVMLLSSINPVLGIWSLITSMTTFPILIVQILDWNSFWTDRRTTRNISAGAVVVGVIGSSCFSARLTHLAVSHKIFDWTIQSQTWLLLFDVSIVFWAIVLYIITKPRNLQMRPESSMIM